GLGETTLERIETEPVAIVRAGAEPTDHRQRTLLRPCRNRPNCRAAKSRNERAAIHSITSSASESRLSEIAIPSAFAVLRLITSSNFVACWTGRSAALVPLRILAV